MVWKIDNPEGCESNKIMWEVAPYLKGQGVDLGAGTFKVLPHVISVDNGHHAVNFGHTIHPDVWVETCEKMPIFASKSMDFVYSSHLLEHIEDYKSALTEWWRILKVGGYLILYLPHKDFYPNMGVEGSNPDHKHDFLPSDIIEAMQEHSGWDLIECQERNEDQEYSMLLIFKKVGKSAREQSWKLPKAGKRVLVCRFGAFGHLMQSSSVFAGLKKQGWHVTLMTSRPGYDIITEDPNIDEVMLLDKDQIPNHKLGDFWTWQAKKYDKFVNLSESVEGTFLALPNKTASMWWTPAVRHKMLNHNYVQHQHELAGVPHEPVIKFYSTLDERAWAKAQRGRMGKFVILWSLAGSSVHKTWAGLDAIVAALMLNYSEVEVVMCGGPETAILEAGWENEKRVHLTCGKWNIRQTLAFIPEADLVMGPETGVLNAAAMESMPKLLFLSHSTEENLSRDWINTVSLQSKGTKCKGRGNDEAPACHLIHYNWDACTKDADTGTAQCQTDISEEEVYFHLEQFIDRALKIERAA